MRGSSSTTRMVATATILVSAKVLNRSLVRRLRWRRCSRAGRLLAMRPLMPLLHPLIDCRRHAVAVPALVAPSAAAPVPASEENNPEQPKEAEHNEQDPEEAEEAEGMRPAAVVVGRRHRCSTGRHLGRQTVRPSNTVGDD